MSGTPARFLSAAVLASVLSTTGARAAGRIEDDYPRALAEAKRLGVPILVDVWAPW